MDLQTLGFNTVVMSNSATAVILTIALYGALNLLAQVGTRWWLTRHRIRLPARFFGRSRFIHLRDAWSDGAIACFGLAALSVIGAMSVALTVLGVLGAVGALIARTLGDSAQSGRFAIVVE